MDGELLVSFPPSREGGLARWRDFLPRVAQYAARRNYDRPGHQDVSRLSPYFTTRLLTEEEVVRELLAAHSWSAVEKFVQEVCWRTYWKGWLEQRPGVWEDFVREEGELRLRWEGEEKLDAAEEGRTGIECYDKWVRELLDTGYLHNHARMWLASIWIFTLELPWELGAGFFHRHLLDGDPASNTLSWRWVAGRQTVGKHYVATAENIRKFTDGRFYPKGQLREDAQSQSGPPHPSPKGFPVPRMAPPTQDERIGLLLLGCDLSPEESPLADWPVASVAGGWPGEALGWWRPVPRVVDFYREASREALARVAGHFRAESVELGESDWLGAVRDWVEKGGINRVVTLYPPVGPWADLWKRVVRELPGKRCDVVIRPWDLRLWPHATRGFFPFKNQLPAELAGLVR